MPTNSPATELPAVVDPLKPANIRRFVLGCVILSVCLLIGEGISQGLRLPIPGNVIGMVVLALGLRVGLVSYRLVKYAADFFLKNIALFFVPPGVGVMLHYRLIAEHWIAIVLVSVLTTLGVLLAVGWCAEKWGRAG